MKVKQIPSFPIDLLALVAVRLNCYLMSTLPEAWGFRLARFLIGCFRLVLPRMDKAGRRNLELVFPERLPAERERILEQSYDVLARNMLSFARSPLLTREQAAAMIDFSKGRELLDRLTAESHGIGILLPTLHFGSFEQLVHFNALLGQKGAFLVRNFELPMLDRWWEERREMTGNDFFSREGGYREMERRLLAGQNVCVLFDQNVKINHAIIPFPKFLGIEAATTKALGLAALRTKARIIFAVCREIEPWKYELICEEVKNPWDEEGSRDEKVLRLMNRLHAIAERVIRQYPEHWFWVHRRFKTRPPGEPERIYR